MAERKARLNGKIIMELLGEVNEGLGKRGIKAKMLCVGGIAFALRRDDRITGDVDVINSELDDEVRAVIKEVGIKHGFEHDWLNNQASNIVPVQNLARYKRRVLFLGDHLEVMCLEDDFLLGSKIFAGREKDMDDLVALVKEYDYNKQEDVLKLPKVCMGIL